MRVNRIQAKMKAPILVSQATARLQDHQIVFLFHLLLRTMIGCCEDRGRRTILVEGRILRTIGDKGRQPQSSAKVHLRCYPLQITIRTRGMGTDARDGTSQIL